MYMYVSRDIGHIYGESVCEDTTCIISDCRLELDPHCLVSDRFINSTYTQGWLYIRLGKEVDTDTA